MDGTARFSGAGPEGGPVLGLLLKGGKNMIKLDTGLRVFNVLACLALCHYMTEGPRDLASATVAALVVANTARLIGGIVDYFTGLFSD